MNKYRNNLTFLFRENIKEWMSAKGITILFVLIFFTFAQEYYVFDFADYYSVKLVPVMLPYLFADSVFTMIFGLTVIYYYSNVPYIFPESFFSLIRLGRFRWTLLQIGRIIIGAFMFILIELLISIFLCIGRIQWSTEWGAVWNTVSISASNIHAEFDIARNIIALYTPISATVRILVIGGLVIAFIGLFQFLLSLYFNRTIAMIIIGILCVGPIISSGWVYHNLYYLSPLSWIGIVEHSGSYMKEGPNTIFMFLVLIGSILVTSVMTLLKISTINLYENQEE